MNHRTTDLEISPQTEGASGMHHLVKLVADYTMGLNNKAFKNWEFAPVINGLIALGEPRQLEAVAGARRRVPGALVALTLVRAAAMRHRLLDRAAHARVAGRVLGRSAGRNT